MVKCEDCEFYEISTEDQFDACEPIDLCTVEPRSAIGMSVKELHNCSKFKPLNIAKKIGVTKKSYIKNRNFRKRFD